MNRFSFFIVAVLLFLSSYKTNAQCISQQEFDALVALYNATGGANWTNNTGWNINGAPCNVSNDWYGITVEGGHVTYLYLQNNNLNGNLPSEIGNLSWLIRLYAYENHLTGSIPPEIGLISSLDYLRIENNELSGQIPSQIGTLTNLRVLHISNNNLDGPIPPEFYNLTELTGVQMYNNSFTGSISPLIGSLTNLRSLYLYGNQLNGSIPPEIGNLTMLNYLFLNGNQISGNIPNEIGDLTKLESLSLQGNNLTGTLPASIGGLNDLSLLKVGDNQLEGEIHESIFNLTNMTNFQLNDNQFTGTISTNISSLLNLQYAYLNGNQFSGDFPVIDGLNNLIRLRLNDNQFENLPTLSNLTSLTNLEVNNNNLTFEDIEPNLTIANFTYVPQKIIGNELNYSVVKGNSYTISVNVGGSSNTYQWYKDGVGIIGATNASYAITNFNETDVATYHCEIKSDIVTDLTLRSNNFNLGITIGLVTIDATSNTESNTCSISGIITETEFPSNSGYSFAPEVVPGTAQLEIRTATLATKRIRFYLNNSYDITNVQIEIGGNYVPLYDGFYTISKIEENLHSTILLNHIEDICIYYPD